MLLDEFGLGPLDSRLREQRRGALMQKPTITPPQPGALSKGQQWGALLTELGGAMAGPQSWQPGMAGGMMRNMLDVKQQEEVQRYALERQQQMDTRQGEQDAIMNRYREAQIAKMSDPAAAGGNDPALVKEYQWAIDNGHFEGTLREYIAMKRQAGTTMKIGDVPHALTEGGQWSPIRTAEQIGEDSATIKSAEIIASEEARNQAAASEVIKQSQPMRENFERILSDPLFEASVGPLAGRAGGMKAALGSKAGELTKQLDMAATDLLLEAAQRLTGPKSDADIKMLRSTKPEVTDPPQVWRDWYENRYLPTMRSYEERAGSTDAPNVVDFAEVYGE